MMKRILLALSMLFLCQLSFANTCPSVHDIQTNAIKGWKILDTDDGTPLSAQRNAEFKKSVEQFALVEWSNDGQKRGLIHCFYRDKNGSDLEAYLENENLTPMASNNFWYSVSGSMHCAAGPDKCQFQNKPVEAQFAKNSIFP